MLGTSDMLSCLFESPHTTSYKQKSEEGANACGFSSTHALGEKWWDQAWY